MSWPSKVQPARLGRTEQIVRDEQKMVVTDMPGDRFFAIAVIQSACLVGPSRLQ